MKTPLAISTPPRSSAAPDIAKMVAELERQRFFGSVEISLQAGRVVLIRKVQTLKLEEISRRENWRNGNET